MYAVLLLCAAFFACKKGGAGNETPGSPPDEKTLVSADSAGGVFGYANDEAVRLAFTLDYRSENPEPETEAETLGVSARMAPPKNASTVEIIPGLRKLSDYKTAYNTEPALLEAAPAGRIPPHGDAGQLTVVDWGPQKFLSSAVQRPSIFVIFSQPMTPLAALGIASDTSPIVSIYPPLKGVFRWYGTSFLSFEGEEPCASQQTYTITVSPDAESLYGVKIEGPARFSFETERLAMKALEPGIEFKKETGFRFSEDDVPPAAAKKITISFNYPVKAADIKNYIAIASEAGGQKDFELTQIDGSRVLASLSGDVEFNTRVTVTLKAGAASGGGNLGTKTDQVLSFRTPGPFVVENISRPSPWGKYFNLFDIEFSARLNESTVRSAIRTEPEMPLTKDNVEVWGNTVRIFNLPLDFNEKFRIIVDTGVEDVYGRRLEKRHETEITMPPEPLPVGSAVFLDRGDSMLEAQFEPRLLFEYKNIAEKSFYTLEQKNNPWSPFSVKTDTVYLENFDKNFRYFEEIDLRPYLNPEGRGFVTFNAALNLLRRGVDPATGKQKTVPGENTLRLQVTDLGLTVRYAFNKTVVMVTSLSTGKPVEGAAVKLLAGGVVKEFEDISEAECIAQSLTDKDGLAVLETKAGVLRNMEVSKDLRGRAPFVFAEKDGDRAVFQPYSHNAWRFGVNALEPAEAEAARPVTFLFSDRGLYKPGETLMFRGVDRTLVLGIYAIYSGGYTVELVKSGWQGETVASVEGVASESGACYGSIRLDEELAPGEYILRYSRAKGGVCASVPVTVAYFERLKFQASVSAPVVDVIAGDEINLTLEASYLSGGNLGGAEWDASWFRQLSGFYPGTAETKNFVFGPRNVYDGKRAVSSSHGVLSGDGKAALTQKTLTDSIPGAAYSYLVDATVTDVSNQQISASRSVNVHPALFYIGIERPASGGFAKAGEELSFNYITVNPSGGKLDDNSRFLNKGDGAGLISVELIREEWNRVQQRGVNNYIYDNYERTEAQDGSERLALKTSGSVKVKPSKAGFYILRLYGFDREGRKALTEYTFYVTGANFSYWSRNDSNEINLVPGKAVYNPGDTAEILLQSPLPAGRYLVTVEREGIFTEEVRTFDEAVSVIKVPVARNFTPVVYLSVSSYSTRQGPPVHGYGTPDLDKPKGCYGVTKLFVNPRTRAFSVKVEGGGKVFRPGEEITLTLTAERDGVPLPGAELSLMAVDRGVLDLVNYHVPDPVSYFYDEGLFPLGVSGGDSRALLMDPVTYSVKNLYGGDSGGDKIEERADFNPTAVFEPFLLTDENGRVKCTFTLPDTLTTYRITVFGVRGDLFSLKETEIAARNVLNVQQVQPRRLRERDTAEAGVLITNLDSVPHKVSVSLGIEAPRAADDDGGLVTPEGSAFVDGSAEHTVTVKAGGKALVYFDVAAEKKGVVNLVYTVKSEALNERLVSGMVIEKPYITETVVTTGALSGDDREESEALVLPSFADNGEGSFAVTLDAARLSLLESAVDYLFHYPYGCMEQRSAAVLPLVIFAEYIDALKLSSEVSNPRKAAQKEIASWVKAQCPDGGFSYWPGGAASDPYVSLRIAHTIALAEEKNIPVPAALGTDKLYDYLYREYQKLYRENSRGTSGVKSAQAAYTRNVYLQGYMLYVFSLLKKPVDASRIQALAAANKDNPAVLAFAGLTAEAISRGDIADDMARTLRSLLRPDARGVDLSGGGDSEAYYGGKTERLALTLQFFAGRYPGDDINSRLLYTLLSNKKADGYWDNTAVTARVLAAVSRLIQTENLDKTNLTGAVTLDGRKLLDANFKGLGAKPLTKTLGIKDFPLAALPRDTLVPFTVTRRGTGGLYWTAALTYALPAETLPRRDEGIGVFQTVYDYESGDTVKENRLESGKLYRAELRVSSSRDRTFLALRAPVPSGAEILDAAFVTTSSAAPGNTDENESPPDDYYKRAVSSQAVFDNEIQYFWDRFEAGETTVRFLFRAARRGVYPVPPAEAECMYESEVFGRADGALYTIQ